MARAGGAAAPERPSARPRSALTVSTADCLLSKVHRVIKSRTTQGATYLPWPTGLIPGALDGFADGPALVFGP